MKKQLYKSYVFLIAFLYKPFWSIFSYFSSKKQRNKRVLVFADGTFDSNAMMVLPVANELSSKKLEVWFSFEYGHLKTQHILHHLHPTIKIFSLKQSTLIRFFSFYQTNRIKRIIGFLVYPIKILQLLNLSRPNYILLANDIMIPSKTLAHFANFLKIPNLSLQHGALCSPFFPITAEKMGVYSNNVKEFIIKNGWATAEKIIITGNPKWDYIHEWTFKNIKKVNLQNILILSQVPGYLLDSKNPDDNIGRIFGLVQKLSLAFPKCIIQIRLHPLEDGMLWQKKIDFSNHHNIVLCDKEEQLLSLLKRVDICISGATTAFYEAALLDVQCIAFRPSHSTIAVPNVTEMDNFLTVCKNEKEVVEYIKDYYEKPIEHKKSNSICPVSYFGYSTKFLAEHIQQIIKT